VAPPGALLPQPVPAGPVLRQEKCRPTVPPWRRPTGQSVLEEPAGLVGNLHSLILLAKSRRRLQPVPVPVPAVAARGSVSAVMGPRTPPKAPARRGSVATSHVYEVETVDHTPTDDEAATDAVDGDEFNDGGDEAAADAACGDEAAADDIGGEAAADAEQAIDGDEHADDGEAAAAAEHADDGEAAATAEDGEADADDQGSQCTLESAEDMHDGEVVSCAHICKCVWSVCELWACGCACVGACTCARDCVSVCVYVEACVA
jgi:hypothetical protein